MRKLFLIRHAKSSWSDLQADDFDRKLNKRGKRDAPFMGKRLAKYGVMPQTFYSSPAERARKTAVTIAKRIGFPVKKISFVNDLYTFSTQELLKMLQEIPREEVSILLVGHNHAITDLVNILTGADIENVPTAGIVAMEFKAKSWSKIKVGEGTLLFFDFPKKHGDRR